MCWRRSSMLWRWGHGLLWPVADWLVTDWWLIGEAHLGMRNFKGERYMRYAKVVLLVTQWFLVLLVRWLDPVGHVGCMKIFAVTNPRETSVDFDGPWRFLKRFVLIEREREIPGVHPRNIFGQANASEADEAQGLENGGYPKIVYNGENVWKCHHRIFITDIKLWI